MALGYIEVCLCRCNLHRFAAFGRSWSPQSYELVVIWLGFHIRPLRVRGSGLLTVGSVDTGFRFMPKTEAHIKPYKWSKAPSKGAKPA